MESRKKQVIKILMVEDDPIDAQTLATHIQSLSEHDNGEIAYEWKTVLSLSEVEPVFQSFDPDVILLDLHLPDGTGQACLDYILSLPGSVPVIVLTGLDDESMARKMIQAGAQDFLSKASINSDLLYRAITYAIERGKLMASLDQTQKELAYVNKKVRQYAKSKTEFTSMVSHELRTPITVMMAILDNLEDMVLGPLTEDQLHYVRLLKNNGNRLSDLVTDILDLSQQETGKFRIRLKECDIKSVIEDTLAGYAVQAESSGVTYSYEMSDELPAMYVDANKVLQVVTNLLNNAFKFTNDGGSIRVVVGVNTNTKTGREEIVFSVQDTGIGIPDEKKGLIFDPYFQAHWSSTRTANGAGLGLTICRGIVEQHDGRIWVENNPDKQGSKFTFTLPVVEQKTAPRILLVENNPLSAKQLTSLIKRVSDFDIYTVKDGVQAIQKFEVIQPDLIITDVLMPRMDGIELYDTVHKMLNEPPEFIFVSGIMNADIDAALSEREAQFVSKPIDEDLFLDFVRSSLPG